ncbi:hypothetical protein BBAL3_873 [Brevundimonas sp. BAL3]|nr:hypothetical protein BBAL3_873 [Brevundimonas sp. BAL3]
MSRSLTFDDSAWFDLLIGRRSNSLHPLVTHRIRRPAVTDT